jgi:hypothetical protein
MPVSVRDQIEDDFSFASALTTNGILHSVDALSGLFLLNVTTITGTNPTLTVKMQYSDGQGNFLDLPGASLTTRTAMGITAFGIGPGIRRVPFRSVNKLLPSFYRWVYTTTGSGISIIIRFKGVLYR